MNSFLVFAILEILFVGNLFAKSLDAHVHGDVQLDIAAEKNQLLVMLKAPSESFLGFEYSPKSRNEIALTQKVKQFWNTRLLSYLGSSTLDDCRIEKSKWEQRFSGKNHSNIIAESYIRCSKPLGKRSLHISLRKKYKRIKYIRVQVLREDGSVFNKKYSDIEFKVKL